MRGADDVAAVDALEVEAGDAEVGVAELALNHDKRNAFMCHLDRVGVPQLMWQRIGASCQLRQPVM